MVTTYLLAAVDEKALKTFSAVENAFKCLFVNMVVYDFILCTLIIRQEKSVSLHTRVRRKTHCSNPFRTPKSKK